MDAISSDVSTLDGNRLLHRLLETELMIESLENGVVLAYSFSLVDLARIVATIKGILNAMTEKVKRIVHQRVGNHFVGAQHLRCLCLQQHLLPEIGILLQLCLCTVQPVLLDKLLTHLTEHQAADHSLGCHADPDALTGFQSKSLGSISLHLKDNLFQQDLECEEITLS